MTSRWFRVPEWCSAMHDESHARKARAWVYLLGSWHAGFSPSILDIRKATGFGAGMSLRLRRSVAEWAIRSGAAIPDDIVNLVNPPERLDVGSMPDVGEDRNGSRARNSSSGSEETIKEDGGVRDLASDARDTTPTSETSNPLPGAPVPTQTSLLPEPAVEAGPDDLDLPKLLGGDLTLLAPLKLAGIHTVEALTALTGAEVRNRRGMGPKRVIVIQDALRAHGLDFAPEPTKGRKAPKGEFPGMKDLTDRWCAFFQRATGERYVWTSGGQTSDNKAAQAIYAAVGWSANPSPEVQADVSGTVNRYVRHRRAINQVPTLYDLARNLAQYRQADALVEAGSRGRAHVDTNEEKGRRTMDGIRSLLNAFPTRSPTDADA